MKSASLKGTRVVPNVRCPNKKCQAFVITNQTEMWCLGGAKCDYWKERNYQPCSMEQSKELIKDETLQSL